ncbi:hypothetical protein C2G38_2112586 [Gigaspora rosea]|uniref:Uncharacterized protein n=1 Tax=Gigaspora rosea TaxID=44941 RepID=A0A397UCC1_9GLOM|nr:hypothetical protein C2G38_2112586 [Gigaspora rosea]
MLSSSLCSHFFWCFRHCCVVFLLSFFLLCRVVKWFRFFFGLSSFCGVFAVVFFFVLLSLLCSVFVVVFFGAFIVVRVVLFVALLWCFYRRFVCFWLSFGGVFGCRLWSFHRRLMVLFVIVWCFWWSFSIV